MTKEEIIKVLQSIEDRAVDLPHMTASDWVAIAAAKRHLGNSIDTKEADLDRKITFKSGWDAAIKEIKIEIERRRNESTWAEYNEALDDMLSFLYTIKK